MRELAKYVKDPKLFEEYAKMRNNPDDLEYKAHVQKMKNVAESRKNMKIDMRPKVLMRTMTGEVLLVLCSVMAVIAMPVYFLKVRPVQLAGVEHREQMKKDQWVKDDELHQKQRQQYIKGNLRSDLSLTTTEKGSILTKEQRQQKIKKMEREYERQLLQAKRHDRQMAQEQRQ